jgi:hypothetical protein
MENSSDILTFFMIHEKLEIDLIWEPHYRTTREIHVCEWEVFYRPLFIQEKNPRRIKDLTRSHFTRWTNAPRSKIFIHGHNTHQGKTGIVRRNGKPSSARPHYAQANVPIYIHLIHSITIFDFIWRIQLLQWFSNFLARL